MKIITLLRIGLYALNRMCFNKTFTNKAMKSKINQIEANKKLGSKTLY